MLTLGVALPLNYNTGDPDAHTWCSSPTQLSHSTIVLPLNYPILETQMLTLGVVLPLNYNTGDPDAHTWCSSPTQL